MRIGVCVGDDVQKIGIAKTSGFHYVESCFSLLAEADEEKFSAFLEESIRIGMPCESVNCFLPGSLPMIGPEADNDKLRDYIGRGMARGKILGVKTVVFGSSGARRIPDGFPYRSAVLQTIRFLREIAGPLAAENGITIVIEPLCRSDANFINYVREGAAIAAAADMDNIRSLGDLYHMYKVGDDYGDILAVGDMLRHAHIAEPSCRVYPADASEFDYKGFIDALRAVGCERCSLEAGTKDFAHDAPIAADILCNL